MIYLWCGFWLSAFLMAYHIFGYGALLYIINTLIPRKPESKHQLNDTTPSIIVLCPAFNEARVIEAKIKSFIALDYPKDRIHMIVISDDSTDATNDIVSKYTDQNISLVVQKPRAGKQCAHNLVLPMLDSDYVLSTDANSIFAPDAVNKLVSMMQSDPRIGMVSGELRLHTKEGNSSGEGLYWRYESFLKSMDSSFASIIGANGSIFLIKRELFGRVDPASVDDFERTLQVLKQGYLAKYEPAANVWEDETEKASEEINRKIRIITQEWYALSRNRELLNVFKHPRISFLLLSHKLLRWLYFVLGFICLVCSAMLAGHWFYLLALLLQLAGYAYGTLGLIGQAHNHRLPLSGIPGYFVAMFYASAIAFKNFIVRKNFGTWNPVR